MVLFLNYHHTIAIMQALSSFIQRLDQIFNKRFKNVFFQPIDRVFDKYRLN